MTETMTDTAIRVLLVEDDEADSLSTRALLEQTGQRFEVGWATSFEEGLSALRHDGYDVALVDYQLGGPTGLDLIRAAIKEGLTPPMILLTGRDDREIDLAATQAGAADFLVKSEITPALLERALRYALERQRSQRMLAQLARTDALTGLLNRFGFNERLDETLGRAKRSGSSGVVLFLDLDGFKPVNDKFGHGVGDALLKHVASILQRCVRREDVPARLGGDEFVVLLEETGPSYDAAIVAERIVDAIDQPFEHDDCTAYITASIGVAMFPDDGDSAELLIKSADTAMYEVKDTGRNGWSFFSQDMMREINAHQEIRHALHKAYEREEFLLHYQPQVDARTGTVLGAEALLRWQRGDQLVSPAAFIPALEQSGLIDKVGRWVLRAGCMQARHWQDAGLGALRIAVNLSPNQFHGSSLVEYIKDALDQAKLEPHLLEVEITEGLMMADPQLAADRVREIQSLGVSIAIDDFGTGYSSLGYIRRFSINTLKIDREFVKDIPQSDDGMLARTIINLADNLGFDVVAEGVETADQEAFLIGEGCSTMQGYLYSKPLPAAALDDLLRK